MNELIKINYDNADRPTVSGRGLCVEKLCDTSNKFKQLYSGNIKGYVSHTEADFAFCKLIAPLCHFNAEVMDKIYRSSGLMRPKWDRKQQGSTFGQIILHKAISDRWI